MIASKRRVGDPTHSGAQRPTRVPELLFPGPLPAPSLAGYVSDSHLENRSSQASSRSQQQIMSIVTFQTAPFYGHDGRDTVTRRHIGHLFLSRGKFTARWQHASITCTQAWKIDKSTPIPIYLFTESMWLAMMLSSSF